MQLSVEEIFSASGVEVRDLATMEEAVAAIFARYGPVAIAVKSQHAYQRTLAWEERRRSDAEPAFDAVLLGRATEAERLCAGDWIWARVVEQCVEHQLPLKLHTGYYAGSGSEMPVGRIQTGQLSTLLSRYPDARFVLMHIAYPYDAELVAVAKHFPNVWVDLCWAWAIDPHTTCDFVRRFLHAVPASKLFAFGGDDRWPTSAVGDAWQARKWLTRALEAELAEGDLTEAEAIDIARRVMHDNQYACFDIHGTRRALAEQAELATQGGRTP
jgi:predicted TIM-barrel fold metal-dependent hydrolase